MKIALCIPVFGTVPVKFFISFAYTFRDLLKSKDYNIELFILSNQPVDESRNKLVKQALEANCDYIFFVDSDMIINKPHLDCLLNLNTDIASALYFAKEKPYVPMMMKANNGKHSLIADFNEGDIIDADAVGCGCMLIKSEVFKKISYPWFKFNWENNKGEDVSFCEKVKKEGFEIKVHTGAICEHYGAEVRLENYLYFKKLNKSGGKNE